MTRCRLVPAVALLVCVGCGVGVDAAPRPLEPITSVPRRPTPTVVELPDDRSARCLPTSTPPTSTAPAPSRVPEAPLSTPPTTAESC